uniref:Uncharacterized protein n=1 Tax=Anguilla anguilla TaxID=7936 RepID=A0A0E9SHK1_ANGAN
MIAMNEFCDHTCDYTFAKVCGHLNITHICTC